MSQHALPTKGRDPAEAPMAGSEPAPVWMFVLLGLLLYWGMHHLDQSAGGFHARVYEPFPSIAYMEALIPKSDADALFANGQRIYANNCSVCHQPTGQGVPMLNPPLAGSEWVLVSAPDRLIRLVLNGIQGPITVKGQNYNGAMPPWRDLLSDEDIAAVLTYVRANAAWGNDAGPVSADQVKAIREETSTRATAWSPDELLRVPLSQ